MRSARGRSRCRPGCSAATPLNFLYESGTVHGPELVDVSNAASRWPLPTFGDAANSTRPKPYAPLSTRTIGRSSVVA